ncbi:hypothetical protein [Haladaptatus sp. DFWS20]|uniref:hypothetical protein n=1 Tax=Haladaptatus sp. DFWS20 TaxID=3403467 RepID=UPI003EB77E52
MSELPVAFEDGTESYNDHLPYPVVQYPGHYGAFIGFKSETDSPLYFCTCAAEAIENYLTYHARTSSRPNADPNKNHIVSSNVFPIELTEYFREQDIHDPDEIISQLHFEDQLCHQCNAVVPKYAYCNDMYGTVFMQNYGWYVNQKHYEHGVFSTVTTTPLTDVSLDFCSDEIRDLLDDDVKTQIERFNEISIAGVQLHPTATDTEAKEFAHLEDALKRQQKAVSDALENEVRRAVGHYEKGSRWTSETILYQLVNTCYNEYTIRRHYRPDFLGGLELDIYLEEADIGIEYQGVQHYEVVEHWGGEEGLQKRQHRDQVKQNLCEEHGVTLVYVRHDESLSEDVVTEKLDPLVSE